MSQSSQFDNVQPSFSQVITMFGMQALMGCGKVPNPMTKQYETDLPMANYHIRVLELLLEKTKGNLSADESKMFDEILHQARMAFIDAQRSSGGPEAIDTKSVQS